MNIKLKSGKNGQHLELEEGITVVFSNDSKLDSDKSIAVLADRFATRGEYESSGVMINVLNKNEAGLMAVRQIIVNGISVLYLQDGYSKLSKSEKELVSFADIILINSEIVNSSTDEYISDFEPSAIIVFGSKDADFKKHISIDDFEEVSKVNIKKSDINSEDNSTKVYILS